MATFRVGVGSFNIQDGAVGFGTDTDGLGNLKVKGVTKTTDIKVSGASTLTRYSGFAADNINQLEKLPCYNTYGIEIVSILVVTVADDELLIVTLNSTFEPLITPSNVPSIDPVATADSSIVVTVVPSCINKYRPT